jgi:hypothetical protein
MSRTSRSAAETHIQGLEPTRKILRNHLQARVGKLRQIIEFQRQTFPVHIFPQCLHEGEISRVLGGLLTKKQCSSARISNSAQLRPARPAPPKPVLSAVISTSIGARSPPHGKQKFKDFKSMFAQGSGRQRASTWPSTCRTANCDLRSYICS